MKNKITKISLCFCFALFSIWNNAIAQDGTPVVKYRRSSLHLIMVEMENFPNKDVVLKSFNEMPFPDKYDNQTISDKSFDPAKYPLTVEEKALIYKSSKLGKLAASSSGIKIDSAKKELSVKIEKYFKQNKTANKLVAKWFNRQDDGSFDMSLIAKRGSYNASEMDVNIAKSSVRGKAAIEDAGIELIGNTFVIVNKFNYVANEPIARVIRDELKKANAENIKVAMLLEKANKAADAVYEKTKEGYSVWATAFLYKLVWNDSISSIFYNNLWIDKAHVDAKKKDAFDKTDLFKLEFIGSESASSLVTFSLTGPKRTESEVIKVATIRTTDNVYSKLQKEYDVFKPKVPLYSGQPITAKIGMKEGLEGGEKFEVLEQTVNEKTGLTEYISKGTIKVEKDLIWDNRYDAANEPDAKPAIDITTFSGGKKYYSGMLIKQLK